MERARIREGETANLGRVEGDLWAEDHCLIRAADGRSVGVSGKAEFEGSVEIDCDFECRSLESSEGLVRVNGALNVSERVDVEEALYVRGGVKAVDIDVGGRLSVGGSLEARRVDVGGYVDVQGDAAADSVDIGGSIDVSGSIKLRDLDVGGTAGVGGGESTGKIDVGGKFRSARALRFDRIDTGGIVELAGGQGKLVEVGGKLTSKGDLLCEEVRVGGVADVDGSLKGKISEVGGKIRVSGDLQMDERIQVGGVTEIGGLLTGRDVEVGGILKASKGVLQGRVVIGGRVETRDGLKAETVELGRGARCTGTLVGSRIHLERMSHVQDVYCRDLVAEAGTRLGTVFAEDAEMGDNCVVGRLVYTGELREGSRVIYRVPPEKVDKLPPFPL
jgi:cytoskeletal protein CcmA (bactofilin family)